MTTANYVNPAIESDEDEIVLVGKEQRNYDADEQTLAAGTFLMEVEAIEQTQMPEYVAPGQPPTGQMVDKLRFRFRVVEGDWEGYHAEGLIPLPKNPANEKAKLREWWHTLTGEWIQPKQQIKIRGTLVGKRCMATVINKDSRSGEFTFANVTNIGPLAPPAPARRRPAAPVLDDDDDADLANA